MASEDFVAYRPDTFEVELALGPIGIPACSLIYVAHACLTRHLVSIEGSILTLVYRGNVAMDVTDSERDKFSSR